MKNIITIIFMLFVTISFSQIRSNGALSTTINAESVFLDASASTFTSSPNNGKGIAFPRTDLTAFTFVSEGNFTSFPTGYDGMIVYNTGTGPTISGIQTDVTPGFYYFENLTSNGATATGQWIPIGTNASRTNVVDNTINNTTTIINGVNEKVVVLPGTANGSTTELTLNTSGLTNGPLNVTKLREAKVYLGNELLLIASGTYNSSTNTLVTGDGMVNKLLRDEGPDAYTVELYYE